MAATFEDLPAADRREGVREVVEHAELDPSTLTGRIGYLFPITGDKLASPRGFEPRLPP